MEELNSPIHHEISWSKAHKYFKTPAMNLMKSKIEKLKLMYTMIRYSGSYSQKIVETFFDKYLGHHKIVRWRDGFPIYSSFVPPIWSDASAHLMGATFFGLVADKQIPFQMNVAVTDICNAQCSHCSFYNGIHDENRTMLSKNEYKWLISQAQSIGISHIGFVWWEPLMSEDFFEILADVDTKKSITTLFTNGYFLEENVERLNKLWLTTIAVSLDSPDLHMHEKLRVLPWLKERLIRGIEKARKYNFNLVLSVCLFEGNYFHFSRYMELARKMGFHEVLLLPAIPTWRLKNKPLKVSISGGRALKKMVDKYNQNCDYPPIYHYSWISSSASLWCQGGKKYIYISPYGDLLHCDFASKSYGNIKDDTLSDLLFGNKKLCGF